MKNSAQIAKESGSSPKEVNRIFRRDGVVPVFKKHRTCFFDKYQENYIHEILYFEGKCDTITLESSMNHVESKEELFEKFREFKKETYGINNNK